MSIQEELESLAAIAWKVLHPGDVKLLRDARAALDAKDAEIERLREALEDIVKTSEDRRQARDEYTLGAEHAWNRAADIATAALTPVLRDDDKPSEATSL